MVMVPATVSNNVPGSDFSIGADTALNTITDVSLFWCVRLLIQQFWLKLTELARTGYFYRPELWKSNLENNKITQYRHIHDTSLKERSFVISEVDPKLQ